MRFRYLLVIVLLACASTAGAIDNPVEGLSFIPQIDFLEYPGTPYTPGYKAAQRIDDPDHYRTGVLVVTLNHDTDTSNIVRCIVLGRVVQGQVTLLDNKKDFAIHMFDSKTPRLAILPYQGWRYGGEYVLRFLDSARYRDGRPLTDPRAEWVLNVPVEALPLNDEPPQRTNSPAPQKNVASSNPFPGGRPWVLKYDNHDQPVLVAAEGVNRHAQFEYGPYGRIASRNGISFTYDMSGRRIEDDRYKYTWDWRSRLYVVTVKDEWPDEDGGVFTPTYAGHTVQYEYDALGRLLWRKHYTADGGLVERRDFIWEQQCLVAEIAFTDETLTSLRWRKTYLPGPAGLDDQVQVRVESFPTSDTEEPIDKVYTFLRDELGTVIVLAEEVSGADPAQPPPAVVRYLYTPYGEVTAMGGPAAINHEEFFPGGQSLLFQGFWTDMVTGMAYARVRWYDPRNTHFLSEDPAGAVDSENRYMFAAGRPHVFNDPMGMAVLVTQGDTQQVRIEDENNLAELHAFLASKGYSGDVQAFSQAMSALNPNTDLSNLSRNQMLNFTGVTVEHPVPQGGNLPERLVGASREAIRRHNDAAPDVEAIRQLRALGMPAPNAQGARTGIQSPEWTNSATRRELRNCGVNSVDCISYPSEVVSSAYAAGGDNAAAARYRNRTSAVNMQSDLVSEGWTAYYFTSNSNLTANSGDPQWQRDTAYLNSRLFGTSDTYTAGSERLEVTGVISDYGFDANGNPNAALEQLRSIPFGVGSFEGGMHTFLLMQGSVYEVHWNEPHDSGRLFEIRPIENQSLLNWSHGVVVVPPGQ